MQSLIVFDSSAASIFSPVDIGREGLKEGCISKLVPLINISQILIFDIPGPTKYDCKKIKLFHPSLFLPTQNGPLVGTSTLENGPRPYSNVVVILE